MFEGRPPLPLQMRINCGVLDPAVVVPVAGESAAPRRARAILAKHRQRGAATRAN